jgi:hypothetical protein
MLLGKPDSRKDPLCIELEDMQSAVMQGIGWLYTPHWLCR